MHVLKFEQRKTCWMHIRIHIRICIRIPHTAYRVYRILALDLQQQTCLGHSWVMYSASVTSFAVLFLRLGVIIAGSRHIPQIRYRWLSAIMRIPAVKRSSPVWYHHLWLVVCGPEDMKPGPRSGYCLGGVAEKFDSPPYSERNSALKMVVYIGGRHLQLK